MEKYLFTLVVNTLHESLAIGELLVDVIGPAFVTASMPTETQRDQTILHTYRTAVALNPKQHPILDLLESTEPNIIAIKVSIDRLLLIPSVLMQQQQYQILIKISLISQSSYNLLDRLIDI